MFAWVSDPAWWALAVAFIGLVGNGLWNWLNWRARKVSELNEKLAPPWILEWSNGNVYVLRNSSVFTQREVRISLDESGNMLDSANFPADIDGLASRSFIFVAFMNGSLSRVLQVEWVRPDGSRGLWRGEIPHRLPRM